MTCLRQDLDNETLLHIDAENRRQTLEEELEFLKQVHEQVTPSLSLVLDVERKGKEEYLYSAVLYTVYIPKRSSTDHTVLPEWVTVFGRAYHLDM